MIKIKIFSDFCTSACCSETFMTCNNLEKSLLYNDKYILTDDEDYTHAIILNTAMPELKIPKENVIGLSCEPRPYLELTNTFIRYCIINVSRYYIGNRSDELPDCFIEYYGYLWHEVPLTYIPDKTKLMSIMISNALYAPGHIYRHTLVQHILKNKLPIDIYGRGCIMYNIEDNRLKGEFTNYEPYENYKFHICIENFQENHYFSEKITNTLLAYTTPIYLGCKNINQYFPNSVIELTGNIVKDIELLKNICSNPTIYIKHIDQKEILSKISIENIIKEFI